MATTRLRVDAGTAAEVAWAYLAPSAAPAGVVAAAYACLAAESDALFAAVTAPAGRAPVRVAFTRCESPYDGAEELLASVRGERLLEVTTAAADRDRRHPLLDGDVGGAFDRFRAVHDLLGHAALGAGFDRDAEYATWRFQERFHGPLARRALATELHAKHSVRCATGEAPAHRAVLLDPRLVERAWRAGRWAG